MAAEDRAPRVARPFTNMEVAAAVLRAQPTGDRAGPLLDFHLNGFRPFGPSPLEAAQAVTEQLGAILKVMSAAHADAHAAEQAGTFTDALAILQGSVQSSAFAGLHSLAALAAFFLEQHRGAQ